MDLIQDSIYGDKDHFRQVAISIAKIEGVKHDRS